MTDQQDDRGDRLARLREAIERSRDASESARRALVDARQELIQEFGDWMCGEGRLPTHAEIRVLDELTLAAEHAQRDYLRCMTELAGMIQAARVPLAGRAHARLSAHP